MKIGVPRSLFGQVALLHVVTAVFAILVLPFGVSTMLRRTAAHYEQGILTAKAAAISRTVLSGYDPEHCTGQIPEASTTVTGESGMAFSIVDAHGVTMSFAGPDRAALVAAAPRTERPKFFRRGALQALSVPLGTGACAWLVVSQDTRAPQFVSDDIVRTFLIQFVLFVFPLMLIVPGVGALLMWRMTRRLKNVSSTAAAIGPRTPDVRLPLDRLPREVEPLADAMNRALDRLADGLRVQSEFASNVAHELRTPLAVIRLRIQALPSGPEQDQLLAAIDRATRVVTQLLALVELERPLLETAVRFKPYEVVEALLIDKAAAVLATGRTISLASGGKAATQHGHPELLTLAIENLIDNAIRHTPPGTRITLAVADDGAISVEDNGPGISPQDIDLLTQRHWQADTARGDGVGIGLSIVERIASAGGGQLRITQGAAGRGARFTLIPGKV